MRCASRTIPVSTFMAGGTSERTTSCPAWTSSQTKLSGNIVTVFVPTTIIFIIATDSQAMAGNDFEVE